jgi:hypothetical protein
MWVLVDPENKIVGHTISMTKTDCWALSYNEVAMQLGPEWEKEFWKRWDPSIRSAEKHGYKMKRCKIVLEENIS